MRWHAPAAGVIAALLMQLVGVTSLLIILPACGLLGVLLGCRS